MKLLKKVAFLSIFIIALTIINTKCFARTVTVNTDTLKLRQEPSTSSTTLELLSQGKELEFVEEIDGWYKVNVDGMTGYVSKDYTILESEESGTSNTISEEDTSNTNAENTTTFESTNNENNNQTTNNENTTSTNTTGTANTVKEYVASEMKLLENTPGYILPLVNSSNIYDFAKDSTVMVITETNGWAYIQTEEVNAWVRRDKLEGTSNFGGNTTTTTSTEPEPQTNELDTNTTNSIDTNSTNNVDTNTVDTNNTTGDNQTDTTVKYDNRKTMYVNETSIYVRSGAGTNYQVVETMVYGNSVYVTGESGDWYSVEVNGISGYIAKWLLSDTRPADTTSRGDIEREPETSSEVQQVAQTSSSIGEQIVEYAKQYLGCKYVYGGSGPSTFDCSGFTMYVYKNFGVSLSHSATAQSKNGTYVAKEDLQPGDLVFFKDYETMDGIGHCGIYIGNGDFIHASSGTGYCVKTSTLLSGSYYNRYETARRIL